MVTHVAQRESEEGIVTEEVTAEILRVHTVMVNVYLVGAARRGNEEWVLVDTGFPYSGPFIARKAERRYGEGTRPAAILLTHGHFDHVGGIQQLIRRWPEVPVYAHERELPFLTGRSDYPPSDPWAGGGAVSAMSWIFPRGSINLGDRVFRLPADGSVPELPGWRWIHTPGHTPGHVSFFKEDGRILLAGDAIVTTKQESATALISRRRQVWRPPAYLTMDWDEARRSVQKMADMNPQILAAGHGLPMSGESMREELRSLAGKFDSVARPRHGRYASAPVLADETGVTGVPPPIVDRRIKAFAAFGLAAGISAIAGLRRR